MALISKGKGDGENGRRPSRRRWPARLIMGTILLVFVIKIANYAAPEAIRFASVGKWFSDQARSVETWVRDQSLLHSCPRGSEKHIVPGSYVCAPPSADTPATRIFTSYPLDGGAKEAIYSLVAADSVKSADQLLEGRVVIPRYRTVAIAARQLWSADPYHAAQWRLSYYSLRPTLDLLTAYKQSGDSKYLKRLLAVDNSFFAAEARSPLAWNDPDAVAVRALVLTYQWWELRRLHVLTLSESTRFLAEIDRTGRFLVDPNHYQPGVGDGTNESAALLELGVDFPSLPGAADWLTTARTRIAQSLQLLIGANGARIGNSPYDHFYELDKYWQIYRFGQAVHVPIAADFASRLVAMTRYATYILQPNDSIPLLGTSVEETIHSHASFAGLAEMNPQFKYVLTRGASGAMPSQTSIFLPASGETIMRSGWGSGGNFASQSYLTFNVGASRTNHSALDTLGFTLYGNGKPLLPGPGLYTYTPGAMHNYFTGTASHNDVVVDGRSQTRGAATSGPLVVRNGVTYQSGQTSLYDGVNDMRTVMMLDKNHFLVVDRLHSAREHRYQQMFHLFPGARVRMAGTTVRGVGEDAEQSVTIQQLGRRSSKVWAKQGQRKPPMGLCSARYQVAENCYAIGYDQAGRSASYTTLITVGRRDPKFAIRRAGSDDQYVVNDHRRRFTLSLRETSGRAEWVDAIHPHIPALRSTTLPGLFPLSRWTGSGVGSMAVQPARDAQEQGAKAVLLTAGAGTESATNNDVQADLSRSNLQVRLRLTGYNDRTGDDRAAVMLSLSNHAWAASASIDLRKLYTHYYAGEWMTVSLGRDSSLGTVAGHWHLHGPFSWRDIDGVRLTLQAANSPGAPPTAELERVAAMPWQRSGAVAFVFDDGYRSILPAAAELHSHGMPANVAVIGKDTETPAFGFLNVFNLRWLQDHWGWNIVNHTQDHADAVQDYYRGGAFGLYEQDILDGATFLQRSGLNSAPNWLIYPHGDTNAALSRVVGRLYPFARTTNAGPEAYPYGSPLRVKTLELRAPGDAGDASGYAALTPPAEVIAAARDALRYHTTLIVTLHRIRSLPSDRPGYPMKDLSAIVGGIQRLNVPVLTLSQLDKLDGVPETNRIIVRPAAPSLIVPRFSDVSGGAPTGAGIWSEISQLPAAGADRRVAWLGGDRTTPARRQRAHRPSPPAPSAARRPRAHRSRG